MSTRILSLIFLWLIFFSSSVMSQECSATHSVNAGDEVTVHAILLTTDPNENGEGEPLTLTSLWGGFSATFSEYKVPHSYKFKVNSAGTMTVLGTIAGFEADESCDIDLEVNATHYFTDAQKDILTSVTLGLGTTSTLAWTVSEACAFGIITAPLCAGPNGLIGALTGTAASLGVALLAKDPPDSNYTVIPVLVPPTFPPVVAGNNLTQADAAAMNALLNNEANIVGVLRAIITSINRSSTAASVGDTYWEQKQIAAINSFLIQLGGLLTKEADMREALVALLASENAPIVTITPQQVLSFEQALAYYGWSQDALNYLHQLGVSNADIEDMRAVIFTQDINKVAGNVPTAFANPALIKTFRQAGHALSSFTPFAGVPNASNCHGVSISALTDQFGSIKNAATALGFGSVQNLQSAVTAFCKN
ncbi:hypothetical protein EPO05_06630 [Patescibacteria group bacterium]|nr:MAG: hypothetical protein EPO05_06630 [Patescibacteria group bacterium]